MRLSVLVRSEKNGLGFIRGERPGHVRFVFGSPQNTTEQSTTEQNGTEHKPSIYYYLALK